MIKKAIIFFISAILLLTSCVNANQTEKTNNVDENVPQIYELNLPIAERDGQDMKGAFTVAGNYFYFEGEDGIIYQAPTDNPEAKKAVYELPYWTYGDGYVYASLETVDNHAILSYHQGGAVMGSNERIKINEDGTNEILNSGYSIRKVFGKFTVYVSQDVPPYQNNMAIKKANSKDYINIGSPDYIYGWTWSGNGGGKSNDLYMIGDEIYVLAYYKPMEEIGTTGIHKVNIKTGETTRLCEESAIKFNILDDIIYFIDNDRILYKLQLGQNTAEKLLDYRVNDFVVLNHQIYYVSKKSLELFKLGDNNSVNPDAKVKLLYIEDGYVVCSFESNNITAYKTMVFDEEGNIIFSTPESMKYVKISNNKIYYIKN